MKNSSFGRFSHSHSDTIFVFGAKTGMFVLKFKLYIVGAYITTDILIMVCFII